MITIERILYPIDLSPESDGALRYAIALARVYEAKLFVCHCMESSPLTNDSGREEIIRQLKHSLADQVSRAKPGALKWEGIVRIVGWDEPASTITEEAAKRQVDLIVMQSRRRPHAAALLGSIAEAVCHHAPCPVLVTHPQEREWVNRHTGEIELKRILIAHDFSGDSDLALSWGLALAEEYQAELHLLHVLPPRTEVTLPEHAWLPLDDEGVFQLAERRLESAVPAEARLWCKVNEEVREGKPFREILTYAEENNIDLICIGVRGEGAGLRAIIGSNTDRVLRRAACPVLIARPLKPANFVPSPHDRG
jgi:nucleotide-binding universal stress UspA family protein